MIKIVLPNQIYLIGKVSDLLEVLEDYSKRYDTVKELIEEQIIH